MPCGESWVVTNLPLSSSEISRKCRYELILICVEMMLRHPAAVLCQFPFRVAAAQLAPVQAGALKQSGQHGPDEPNSHRTAVAVISMFAGITSPEPACGGMLFDPSRSWGLRHCTQMSVDFFSFHCSFCPGKGWGLLGRVSGITFMSPNVLKSNNANTRVFSVNGSYLGYQLLLFVRTDICYSRGVIFSLTFCCPCAIWSKKKTQNLYVETGFRLDSLHSKGSSNRLRL